MSITFNKSIYIRTLNLARAFVLSNNGTFVDVEDILQEGIKIFCENLQKDDFRLTTSPENYIYQVCRKLWFKELRRKSIERRPDVDIVLDALCQQDEMEIVIRKEKLFRILENNIEKLTPRGRELFSLKFSGLSLKEIASRMGLKSYKIAKDKCYREKKRLIKLIKQDPEYQKLFYHEQEVKIIEEVY